ncbi:MAG: tRNA 2-thiouridine(34) synthase MnmA [Dehalococcoidales bacterium]|nr:tRNA 2-thiouridine(34) synthase MnmA [Dehalococcoidales bacterium]
MHRKQVAVAVSGGVDSSVAAALLKKSDYDVSGVYMQLWSKNSSPPPDLEQTCRLLDIPLYTLDFRAEFGKLVIDYFCRGYSLGHTPNPCTACNQHIKFGLLLDKVREMGADYLATGHYARVEHSQSGYRLFKGADPAKDQSYFLYTLGQRELSHLLLPLATLQKVDVRRLAAELGLPASNRQDSQDICFIPDSDYRAFIIQHIPLEAGDIVDTAGKILGKHSGLARYTVGQRHKLGLDSSERLYVVRLDNASHRLVVGTRGQLLSSTLVAGNLSWVSGEAPEEPIKVTAKIRYKSPEAAAELYPTNGTVEVWFKQPQWAVTPGQAIVFYEGDAVLGGGIIEATMTKLRSGGDERTRTAE